MKNTIAYYITILYRKFFHYSSDVLQTLDLSYGLLPFLLYVGRYPDCTPSELTQALDMDWGHSQRSITRLVKTGFMTKEKNTKKDRNHHLNLTEQGRRAFDASHQVFHSWEAEALHALTPEEQKTLRRLLQKLTAQPEKGDSSMTYSVVYSSKTGNTKRLAEAVRQVLPEQDCLYFGEPGEEALKADRIYAGFWTDAGTCDKTTAAFLKTIKDKELFLFGTAGFGVDASYFEKILSAVEELLDSSVTVTGHFMCQGKMPMTVRQRYEGMDDSPRKTMMIANFDEALKHPSDEDCKALQEKVKE